MHYDAPIVMVSIIIAHDGVEGEHASVLLSRMEGCLTGKFRANRLVDELERK